MSADWLAGLGPEDQKVWADFVAHTRLETAPMMERSAFVMSLVPTGDVDVKFAVELGMSIMMDKPIVALVLPGAKVPPKLAAVADLVIKTDMETEAGREYLAAELRKFVQSVGLDDDDEPEGTERA